MDESTEKANILRFTPFSSFINSSFWFKFVDIKLDEDMLNEVNRHIWGYYSYSNKTGTVVVDCTSFNEDYDTNISTLHCHGFHINKNTIEGLKSYDKQQLINKHGDLIVEAIRSKRALENPSLLITFVLLSYSDLKSYTFTYWFAFPASADSYDLLNSPQRLSLHMTAEQIQEFSQSHANLPEDQRGFFCVHLEESVRVTTLKEFVENADTKDTSKIYFAFLDPTTLADTPGWPLRNLLLLLKIHCPHLATQKLNILCIRGKVQTWSEESLVFTVEIPSHVISGKFIGWEKNNKGKLAPKSVCLKNDMDQTKLLSRALQLNLKLMKWRLQPDLNLSVVRNTSCLLLGAGTLGCSVARVLLAWGIDKITLVDKGTVSYSNPCRQTLFTFQDAVNGTAKATAAAAALKQIHPALNASGEILQIPVPGHESYDRDQLQRLFQLIEEHDVTFLLTDSRESRWLPTFISALKNKIAITIALGYDSYLVMRHGIAIGTSDKLGCYFCNDVVAPGDSQRDRTLDQQCTVTRPGVSGIAASFGVELLVSLLQYSAKGDAGSADVSCLGKIPHSIRGFLSDYENMYPFTKAFDRCIACSPGVLNEYRVYGEEFLRKVFASREYLEQVTFLSQLHVIDDEFDFPEENDDEF